MGKIVKIISGKLSGSRTAMKRLFLVSLMAFQIAGIPLSQIVPAVYASQSASIGLRVSCDHMPPASITTLKAYTDNTDDGRIRLIWIVPGDNGFRDILPSMAYTIKWDTHSISELGGSTTSWWDMATNSYIPSWTPVNPGSQETGYLTKANNLLPNVTYYIAIRAHDKFFNWATDANVAVAIAGDTAPAKVSNLTALYNYVGNQIDVNLTWSDLSPIEKGLNFRYYCVYRDTSPPEGPGTDYELIGVTNSNSYFDVIDVSLSKAGSFHYRLTAKDYPPLALEGQPSDPTQVIWDMQPPAIPRGLVAAGSDRKVTLSWQANTETDLAGYSLYRSTYSNGYSSVPVNGSLITTTAYEDSSVFNGVTYYYVLTAIDIYENESQRSDEISIMPKDTLLPSEPLGIKGTASPDKSAITITWLAVVANEEGSQCSDLAGYNIYRANAVTGPYEFKNFVLAGDTLSWTDPENITGKVYYYMVRSMDTSYNLSRISGIVDTSFNIELIVANEDDMLTSLIIPKDENSDMLYRNTNPYGDDVRIELTRNTLEEQGRVLKSQTFVAKKGSSGEIIRDFAFKKPTVKITFSYTVRNGVVRSLSSSLSVPEYQASNRLSLFWFNGLEWLKLGGEVDEQLHTVSIHTSRLGKYMLKESVRADSFSIESIQPDKTFTPNGDGWNDYFEMQYTNPYDGIVSGKIYDIKGAYVADMKKGSTDESLVWDGKDSNGNTVSGGVYIYQLEVKGSENKVINGTCVVAK